MCFWCLGGMELIPAKCRVQRHFPAPLEMQWEEQPASPRLLSALGCPGPPTSADPAAGEAGLRRGAGSPPSRFQHLRSFLMAPKFKAVLLWTVRLSLNQLQKKLSISELLSYEQDCSGKGLEMTHWISH